MKEARDKLEKELEGGKARVLSTLESINNEYFVRKDLMVRPTAFSFATNNGVQLQLHEQEQTPAMVLNMTGHSINQAYEKAKIPGTFAERLLKDDSWLLSYNLNELTSLYCTNGLLIRKVGDTVKGYLSASYKRMDACPIFETFVKSCMDIGYEPYRGMNTHSRYHVAFMWPQIFEAGNDVLAFGISVTTSDYGSKALELEMFALRIWCANLMVGYDLLRRVHLGSRFDMGEEVFMQLSNKTFELDTKTISSAVGDLVSQSKSGMEGFRNQISQAAAKEMSTTQARAWLKKSMLLKAEQDKVIHFYESELPVQALPQEQSVWRLSSAISLLAKETHEEDRILDLEKTAYKLVGGVVK